jgi:hypothetical protein
MNPIAVLRRHFANVERSRQMLEEIREGIANLTDVTNRHLMRLAEIMAEAANEARADNARSAMSLANPDTNRSKH